MLVADLIAYWSQLPPDAEVYLDKNEWSDYGDTPEQRLRCLFHFYAKPIDGGAPFVTINN